MIVAFTIFIGITVYLVCYNWCLINNNNNNNNNHDDETLIASKNNRNS